MRVEVVTYGVTIVSGNLFVLSSSSSSSSSPEWILLLNLGPGFPSSNINITHLGRMYDWISLWTNQASLQSSTWNFQISQIRSLIMDARMRLVMWLPGKLKPSSFTSVTKSYSHPPHPCQKRWRLPWKFIRHHPWPLGDKSTGLGSSDCIIILRVIEKNWDIVGTESDGNNS